MNDKGEANRQGRPTPRGHSWGCSSLHWPVSGTKCSDDNAKDTEIREHMGGRGTVAGSVAPLTVNRGQVWKCLCLPTEQPPVAGSSRERFGGWDEGKD